MLRSLSKLYHLSFLSSKIHYTCPLTIRSGPPPPLKDAIATTVLSITPLLPRHCHHAQFLPVAATVLNVKLPHTPQIDGELTCLDAAIRYVIGLLVDLRDNPLYPRQPTPSTSSFTVAYALPSNLALYPPHRTAAWRARHVRPVLFPHSRAVTASPPDLPHFTSCTKVRKSVRRASVCEQGQARTPVKKRRTDARITRALSLSPTMSRPSSRARIRTVQTARCRTLTAQAQALHTCATAFRSLPLIRTLTTIAYDRPAASAQAETDPRKAKGNARHVCAKKISGSICTERRP